MVRNNRLFYFDADVFMRYEQLSDDFRDLCLALCVGPGVLEHQNATPEKKNGYRSYHTPRTVEIIEHKYAQDLQQHNYKWDR
jgi:hypothetical protein